MRGFTCVIIIETLKRLAEAGREPGEVVRYGPPTQRAVARTCPQEVIVFAIEAVDVETFGEELSPPVAAAAERVLDLIRREVGA